MNKIMEMVQAAQHQEGWSVRRPKRGGHWKFTAPDGTLITAAGTPSDRRAWLNVRAMLRRHGLKV